MPNPRKGKEHNKASDHLLQMHLREIVGSRIFHFDTTTRVPKVERTPAPKQPSSTLSRSMPTQSPTQKNTKLKLKWVVQKAPPKEPEACPSSGWQPDRAPPITQWPRSWKIYDLHYAVWTHGPRPLHREIDDLMIFGHERLSITRQVMVSILYTELAWFKGYPYTFPVIPPQLERRCRTPKVLHYANTRKSPRAAELWASRRTAKCGGTTCWHCSNIGRMPTPLSIWRTALT